jgi:hypothetical protein
LGAHGPDTLPTVENELDSSCESDSYEPSVISYSGAGQISADVWR